MPPVTQALLGLNIVVFALQGIFGYGIEANFALWPPAQLDQPMVPSFEIWQLITYGFLHGSFMHVAFNMLALWMFGRDVERALGWRRYLQYYLTCVITAALAQLLVMNLTSTPPYPTVGASGGVFGLLLAYGLLFPRRIVMLLIPPIPMPAKWFVVLYGLLELVLGVTGTQSGVAHFAHLGGLAGGFFLLQFWRGRWPFDSQRR
ncbi:MAG: rhomboid family intramembrane serine protease [Betaproteobacteria bacterium]